MATTLQAVRGMHDILPPQSRYFAHLEQTAREVLGAYGYDEIRLPLIEITELFKRTIGDVTDIVEKEMYTFVDRNGDSLSLRPEGTAGCGRAGSEQGLRHNQVQRLWYAGAMFRHERPQKGRYRQFHQIGVETFGMAGPDIDAELLLLTQRLWRRLGLEGLVLQLNSLGTPAVRAAYREQLVTFICSHRDALDEDSRRRLESNPLRILDSKNPDMAALIAAAPTLSAARDDESRAHFDGLCALLDAAGVAYRVNPRLVRGLDYYTKPVFEWVSDRLGAQGTVCAAGRALGIERLVSLMEEAGTLLPDAEPHAYLVIAGAAAERVGAAWAEQLRDACPGLRLKANCGGGSFKTQMKRADKSGAAYALVLGDDEVAQQRIGIKSLRTDAPQHNRPWQELLRALSSCAATDIVPVLAAAQ